MKIKMDKKPGPFITKEEFKKFLGKNLNRKFKNNCSSCPLSEASDYFVDGYYYSSYMNDDELIGKQETLPNWARDFVEEFDSDGKAKTGKQALKIMEKIEKREALEDKIEELECKRLELQEELDSL